MTDKEKQLVMNFEHLGEDGIAMGLIDAFSSPSIQNTPLVDVLLNATTKAMEQRRNSRADRLLKMAKLHNTSANIDGIEYYPERNLDKLTIDRCQPRLYQGSFQYLCGRCQRDGNYVSCRVM